MVNTVSLNTFTISKQSKFQHRCWQLKAIEYNGVLVVISGITQFVPWHEQIIEPMGKTEDQDQEKMNETTVSGQDGNDLRPGVH